MTSPNKNPEIIKELLADPVVKAVEELPRSQWPADGNATNFILRLAAPIFSEFEEAQRFADRYLNELRYSPAHGWMVWAKTFWKLDGAEFETKGLLKEFLTRECQRVKEIIPDHDKAKFKQDALCSTRMLNAVFSAANLERGLRLNAELDADELLLGVPSGTIDLRTGKLRAARREDYITKHCLVDPGGDCPRWLRFMDEITCGDRELASYLQRLVGYCLTGSVREHALIFFWGEGSNGKGTFIRTLEKIFGRGQASHKTEIPIAALLSGSDRHPTEIAKLAGCRIAVANETPKGRRWNDSLIKHLTGGDTITARFLYQDFFDFAPHHKLIILGNRKPKIDASPASKRRLHLVPFNADFLKTNTINQKLDDELAAEASGILAWAIQGCLEWQRQGLKPPSTVVEASREYFEENDLVGQFGEEKCVFEAERWVSSSDLFKAWDRWCQGNSIKDAGSLPDFITDFKARFNLVPRLAGKKRTRGLQGVELKEKIPVVPRL